MSAIRPALPSGLKTDSPLFQGEVEEVSLLLTRREAARLECLAAREGLSLAQLLRAFIRQGLARAAAAPPPGPPS